MLNKDKVINAFFTMTGGRPMKYDGFNFTDVVDGCSVNNYTDFFGRKWMANNCCSIFRVSLDK